MEIQKATLVKVMPTKVWIESGMLGERIVVLQHEGCEPFDYAVFRYDYRYTSNAVTLAEAEELARKLGATEPIEHKHRELKFPTADDLRKQMADIQSALELLEGNAPNGQGKRLAESTVWRVMHPDGSRTVVGDYMLALAYAKGDRSRIDEITLELRPGPLARELKVMRGMASCGGDDKSIQQAEIDLHRLQHIESAALLALGMLWMTERHSPNAQAAFQTLRNALGGQDALRRGIEAAIDAGFEADHPPCADWWAGKKENGNADQA